MGIQGAIAAFLVPFTLMGELEGAMEAFLMFALMMTTLGEVNYPEGEMSLLNYTYADSH